MKKILPLVLLLLLSLVLPVCLRAETSKKVTTPVPGEQVRHSDDPGQSSTVTEAQPAPAPKKVEGTAYDKNAITVLPGAPTVGLNHASAPVTGVKTYEELRQAISRARAESGARVEKAVEQEKVREAWEIGRLIDAHVLQYKERADYGKQVILRLSKDLSISDTELYYMLQFARTYPNFRAPGKLSWGQYETLLSVNDAAERDELEEKAAKENWTQDRTREEVKKRKAAKNGTPVPEKETTLAAKLGKPGTYRIVKAAVGPETGKVVIDLGFSNYYKTSKDLRLKEGSIIEAALAIPGASSPSDLIRLSKRTPEDLYTYRASVVRVLDGDTLEVVVDLGFGVRSVQTLRLRGIDCPELVSKEGKEAKAFVEKLLTPSTGILIKTTKSDKYDRYLADVFITNKTGEAQYLNNELFKKGLAVQLRE